MIRRYNLYKTFQIYSYGQNYDELPAFWIDALEIIDFNMKRAMEVKNGD